MGVTADLFFGNDLAAEGDSELLVAQYCRAGAGYGVQPGTLPNSRPGAGTGAPPSPLP